MRRGLRAAPLAALAGGVVAPATASAHGGVGGGRSDLPIPEWLFIWAAAIVLVVSFVALAALWPEPRLEGERWRPLPGGRVLTSRPVEILCGAIGVFLLGVVVWAGFNGTQSPGANFAAVFVCVGFWLAPVPLSVVFGDVFRPFNPWRAIGRAVSWAARTAARTDLPAPLEYPAWLGRWPAAAGILGFAVFELVIQGCNEPQTVAVATVVYSALTFLAMALFGVERWTERGEGFSVYFNLFSRLSAFERRDRDIGLRRPLQGLASLEAMPGTVPLLAVMIGSVSFDGASEAPFWTNVAPDIADVFGSLGLSPGAAVQVAYAIGLAVAVLLIYGFYRLAIVGVRSVGGSLSSERLGSLFVHSLVPIAFAYVAAHYLTLLIFQGQLLPVVASDPLGDGSDIFGSAGRAVDYGVIGAETTWYVWIALVVGGHVTALMLAHDRALAVYDQPRLAVRSQYWMLGVMIGFTTLALWLLSQSNQ